MRVQLASDLHLEFYDEKPRGPEFFATLVDPTTGADILVLAGDIGYPERASCRNFIGWCCANWPLVIWVYGNHEYYNGKRTALTMEEKEAAGLAIAADYPNLRILHDEALELEGTDLTILGATLWTNIRPADGEALNSYLSDFATIYAEKGERLTIDDWNALHGAAAGFLESALEEAGAAGRRALVVSHYLPSHRMILPQYAGHPMNSGFAATCDALLDHPAVAAWFCGHSHGSGRVGSCYLNSRGYPGEASQAAYSPRLVVEL